MAESGKFSTIRRKPKPAMLVLIGLFHIVILYGITRALVPDMVQTVEKSVVSAFTVTVTTPEDEPPPENEPVPDEGAAGEQGRKAVPKPQTAPDPEIQLKRDQPMPEASSSGAADSSGAKDRGDGTGAAGSGTGTGSGREGGGMGGIAVTKPVHISGGIDNARDYPVPEGGRQARRGTQVIVKVTVGTNGRARNCSVYRSSPDSDADRITCQLVVDRLRFKPAVDGNGDPVAAPFYWRQRWF